MPVFVAAPAAFPEGRNAPPPGPEVLRAMFFACAVPVAISNFTSGYFFAAFTIAGWKPNDVAKMILFASRTLPALSRSPDPARWLLTSNQHTDQQPHASVLVPRT